MGKLTPDGSALVYLTYFGGNGGDSPGGMAEDPSGNVYLAGSTSSTNLPITNGFQTTNAGESDAFLAKFSLPGSGIIVSPAVVTFPAEGIGIASPMVDVTVANVSKSQIAISSALAPGDFLMSGNNCGKTLAAGAHCRIALAFNPSTSGNRNGTLTITNGTSNHKVQLHGEGVSGPLVTLPSANQINTAARTISPSFPVTITNSGSQPLNITQVSLTNGPAFSFSGATNCFKPIAPKGKCTVRVTFGDFGFGENFAILSFTDDAERSPQSVLLTGNVVGSGLVLSTAALRFGQQLVGSISAAKDVMLLNGTGSPVTIASIKTVGNFIQTNTCGSTLAAGASCDIKVSFRPGALGIKQGSISVSNSSSQTALLLPLLGTGE